MQFAKTKTTTKKEQLIILNEKNKYSNEFKDLTREFYLVL
jgi:tRNA1(Val) A37 N6-methylase TrmN6